MKQVFAISILGLLFWWMMMDRTARDSVYDFSRANILRAGVALHLIKPHRAEEQKPPVEAKTVVHPQTDGTRSRSEPAKR